jgi:fibronectin-binding autotransporter adhesin
LLTDATGYAASSTWVGTGSTSWGTPGATSTNWSTPANSPGATSGTTNADVATFNTAAGSTIALPTYLNVAGLTFSGAAGSFTFNAGTNPLFLTSGGTIGFTSTSTTGTVTQTFNTPITLEGNYTFSNTATSASDTLDFTGAITNAVTTGTTTLTLTGSNTGNNTISGGISNNGTAGAVTAINDTSTGTWIIGGSNTYTGQTSLAGNGTANVSFGTSLLDLTGSTSTSQINSKQGTVELDLNSGFTNSTTTGPALALQNAKFLINGKSSGSSTVTINSLAEGGSATVGNTNALVLQDNGGSGITLKIAGNITTTNALSVLKVTTTGNDVLQSTSSGALSGQNGTFAFAILNQNDILGYTGAAGTTQTLGAAHYTVPTGANPTIGTDATQTILIDGTSSGTVSVSGGFGQINSLLFGDTAARTVSVGGSSAVLLIGTSNGTGTILSRTTAGTLTIGTTPGDGNVGISLNGLLLVNNSSNADVMNSNLGGVGTTASVGQYGVDIAGTGSWALAGNNQYTGGTYLTGGGTLAVNSSAALGVTSSSSSALADTLVISNGSLDNTSGAAVTLGSTSAANDVPVTILSNFTFIGTNSLNLGTGAVGSTVSGLAITVNANTLEFDGAVNFTKGMSKLGSGTLTLGGAYSGAGITVSAGRLNINGTQSAGIAVTSGVGAALGGSGTVTQAAGKTLTIGVNTSLISGGVQMGTTAGTGLTISSPTAIAITGSANSAHTTANTANLTFDLGAGGTTAATFASPNENSTYLSLTGSTSINFVGNTSITLIDLTNGGLNALRLNSPYLLISAASDASYTGLVVLNSSGQLSQTGDGIVEGVYVSGNSSSTYVVDPITFNEFGSNGVTPLTNMNGNVSYSSPYLYLDNGQLELVPEPGTWALMIGGLALLVGIQRRRRGIH